MFGIPILPSKVAGCLIASGILIGATAVAHAVPINALVNSGFEIGDFTGWTVGGNSPTVGVDVDGTTIALPPTGSFLPGISNVRSGTYSAFAHVRGDPSVIVASVTQTILNVLPGNVSVGFFYGTRARRRCGDFFPLRLHNDLYRRRPNLDLCPFIGRGRLSPG